MRGFSVLNYRSENENPEELRIRILKKHSYDLERCRQELREVFGAFLPEKAKPYDPEVYYDYDFTRPVDFEYPIPHIDARFRPIEFLQKGNLVEVPVDFVKRLSVRLEELYD